MERIRALVVVAEELNFTRAAERLGIAQPPLSRAITALERKLGVPLLIRSTRRVELTPAGHILLERARIALDAMAAAARLTERAGQLEPRLNVVVMPGTFAGLLAPSMERYERDGRWPPVEVLISEWDEMEAMLRDGRADVALAREEAIDGSGLDWELLLAEPRRAVVPRAHRLAGRARLRRADLDGEPVPVWRGRDAARNAHFAGIDRLPAPHPLPPGGPEVTDITQLMELVAFGKCIAFLPASAAELLPRDDVVHIPVDDLSDSRLVVAWSSSSRSQAVACFVRAATDAARTSPLALASLG